jgi:hypothetical protein
MSAKYDLGQYAVRHPSTRCGGSGRIGPKSGFSAAVYLSSLLLGVIVKFVQVRKQFAIQ